MHPFQVAVFNLFRLMPVFRRLNMAAVVGPLTFGFLSLKNATVTYM